MIDGGGPTLQGLVERADVERSKARDAGFEMRRARDAIALLFGRPLAARIEGLVEELTEAWSEVEDNLRRALAKSIEISADHRAGQDRIRNQYAGEAATVLRSHREEIDRLKGAHAEQVVHWATEHITIRTLLGYAVEDIQARHAKSHKPLPTWFAAAAEQAIIPTAEDLEAAH